MPLCFWKCTKLSYTYRKKNFAFEVMYKFMTGSTTLHPPPLLKMGFGKIIYCLMKIKTILTILY